MFLWFIIVPVIRNGMLVSAGFIYLTCYIEYMFAASLSVRNSVTIPVFIAAFSSAERIFYQEMIAATIISIIPMIIFFAIVQRSMAKGLTMGAIK